MAATTRETLKGYFQTGARPTEAQFEDLIDSFRIMADAGVGTLDWGDIGGTLADQEDLVAALALKAASSHTHLSAEITDASADPGTASLVLKTDGTGLLTLDSLVATTLFAVGTAAIDGEILMYDNGFLGTLAVSTLAASHTWSLPNATGNLALCASTTGAIQQADVAGLTSTSVATFGGLVLNGDVTINPPDTDESVELRLYNTPRQSSIAANLTAAGIPSILFGLDADIFTGLQAENATASRVIQLPDASGNLALIAGTDGAIQQSDVAGFTASDDVDFASVTTTGLCGSDDGAGAYAKLQSVGADPALLLVLSGSDNALKPNLTGSYVNTLPAATGYLALCASASGAIAQADITGLTTADSVEFDQLTVAGILQGGDIIGDTFVCEEIIIDIITESTGGNGILFNHGPRQASTSLGTISDAGPTALTRGLKYHATVGADTTFTISGAPLAGDTITLHMIVTGSARDVTFPSCQRVGSTDVTPAAPTVTFQVGTHAVVFEYVNSVWRLTDSGDD